jgi:hypothetical protein
MRGPRLMRCARLWFVASAFVSMAGPAEATDLIDAWRAAQQHDLDFAASRAAQLSGERMEIWPLRTTTTITRK